MRVGYRAAVRSRHAAEDIMRCMKAGYPGVSAHPYHRDITGAPMPGNIKSEIQSIMQRAYFVFADESAVRTGLKQLENILKRLKGSKYAVTTEYCEALSMATCAYIVLKEVDEQ